MKKILIPLWLLAGLATAAEIINPGYVDDRKPWAEEQVSLPPFPKDENLLAFTVSSATSNTFMIDTASITVGGDQIIRYTIVIESPRGARTINHEGMRCDSAENKLYAFGQSDGKWTENKRAKWEPFRQRSLLSYHKVLFEDHFCPNGLAIHSAAEGIGNLKRGGSRGLFQ